MDAQLPRRVAGWLISAGCDAVHTLDLQEGNRTTDGRINEIADREDRVVITKDADFVDTHILHSRPKRLLLVSTGNMSNEELANLFLPLIPEVIEAFETCSFLELGATGLVAR